MLAPHEDDEALGASGVIQRALAVGAEVRIVYLTYGDHNEWAFLMYRKNPVLTPGVNLKMGVTRRREATAAMRSLGLSEDHLVFLGFPDNGTLAIWQEHWGSATAFHSLLTNTKKVPYADAACYQRPYKGEEILAALETQLLNFRPTRILVTHPLDSNPDHSAYYVFLQVALLDLQGRWPTPEVYCYPLHMGTWPRPLFYHPDDWLLVPKILRTDPSPWWDFELTPEETARKYNAIRMNKSQMADHAYWLVSLARRNELFTRPQGIPLQGPVWGVGPGAVPHPQTEAYEKGVSTGIVSAVSFSETPGDWIVRVHLRHRIQAEGGLSLSAFGYRHDKAFSQMPKLHLWWSLRRLHAYHQKQEIPAGPFSLQETATDVTFRIPWSELDAPDTIFVQVRGLVGGLPVSQTSWQVVVPSASKPRF